MSPRGSSLFAGGSRGATPDPEETEEDKGPLDEDEEGPADEDEGAEEETDDEEAVDSPARRSKSDTYATSFRCAHCPATFRKAAEADAHQKTCKPPAPLSCRFCKKECKTEVGHAAHEKRCGGEVSPIEAKGDAPMKPPPFTPALVTPAPDVTKAEASPACRHCSKPFAASKKRDQHERQCPKRPARNQVPPPATRKAAPAIVSTGHTRDKAVAPPRAVPQHKGPEIAGAAEHLPATPHEHLLTERARATVEAVRLVESTHAAAIAACSTYARAKDALEQLLADSAPKAPPPRLTTAAPPAPKKPGDQTAAILAAFAGHPQGRKATEDFAAAVGCTRKVLGVMLPYLAKTGRLVRSAPGTYRLP